MELWLPEQLAVSNESRQLMADVEETARKVNEYRPLPEAVVKRIEEELLGERVYSSNAIEGNTLDLRETVMILKKGIVGAKKKREAKEALNLAEAARKIATWTDAPEPCHTVSNLLDVHKAILRDIDDQWAGRFRDKRVMIQGAVHQPPEASLVPSLVERIMNRLFRREDETDTLIRAAWAHWAISRVHPFFDGNGRVARLWQDLTLSQGRLTCAIIRPQDRREYLDALGGADDGDLNPLIQLIAQRVLRAFDIYLIKIAEDRDTNKFIRDIVGEADTRFAEHVTLAYQRWARRMNQLAFEFEFLAARITEESQRIQVQVHRLDIINQAAWGNLRGGLLGGPTSFFKIDFKQEDRFLCYFFFFGKHFWTPDLDSDDERSENRACLLVSEQIGEGDAQPLYKVEQHPISLRELFVVNDQFVRKRFDPALSKSVYDRDVTPRDIAQDFLREVILNRLT